MKPILFDKTDTTFTTQGLGRLSDAISCKVAEERNGAYELEMEYPIDGIHWNDVQVSRIIVAKPNDSSDPQAFRIYRISKPLKKRCMVYAEHISYQLSFIPVMPFTAQSFALALDGMVSHAAESCPFTVWTDKVVTGEYSVSVPTSFRALLGGQAGSVLDVYGTAEYEFDNYVIKAHLNRGINRGVVLRYGKNITDISNSEVTGDTYEEKIRSKAEIKMAEAMIKNGVSYMEYAIEVDGQMISGSTNMMKISSMTFTKEDYQGMLSDLAMIFGAITAVLMFISAFVVMIILSILMETTIRKQYRDLGIMKSMGYTSRELMFQMAFKIIPTAVIAVIFGTVAGIVLIKLIEVFVAKIAISVIGIILVDLAILLFCFICAYGGARKIKKISVYQLITE
ncbi:MAG: FtsX-like permease family protein [Clostridiales bacterium]|nr:FtsX-like permease family protein [Clostridiales bacterium]